MIGENDARISNAETIFDAIVDLPPEERAAALEVRCGDDRELRELVERLLQVDDRTSAEIDEQLPFQPIRQWKPPFQIGRFHVQRTLGEGGMGTVFEAEQDQPKRTVALKLMKRGIMSRSALRRFEYETQILARLHHPGIAHVYDADVYEDGALDPGRGGIPYFVMEYIPSATPITDYAREKKLSTRQRLELFISICDAVQHGHQKGIIHRDLKPGNIVVDSSGAVKVIDFGVARTTDSDMAVTTMQTDVGQLIGTLQYMSPEQCDADPHDLDVRSDVYSLGMILYELLTDLLPYDVSNARIYEATRRIRETMPARPSAFNRALRGDLETIVLKALEKERERRYQSAADLAEDIRRYLTDRPIMARPPSAMYQFRTFARRNKALVGGVAATFIALVAGLIAVSAMYVQAEHLRAEAELRGWETEKVASFQAEMLTGIGVGNIGGRLREDMLAEARLAWQRAGLDDTEIEDRALQLERLVAGTNFTNASIRCLDQHVLRRARDAIVVEFNDVPVVKAALLQTVGDSYRELGLLETAMPPQQQALEIRRRELGEDHPDTLASISSMGILLERQGKIAEAETFLRVALDARRRLLGDEHPDTLKSIGNMGLLLQRKGDYVEAEPYFREALDGFRRILGEEHPETLTSINNMGFWFRELGQYAEAEPYLREALQARRRVLGDEHPSTLVSFSSTGILFWRQGRLAEAESLFHEALDIRRRVLGDEHSDTLESINSIGLLLKDQGKLFEAELYFSEALETRRRVLGNEHPDTLRSVNNMGSLLREQGRVDEAEAYFQEALETRRRVLGSEHPETFASINNMGFLFLQQGKLAEAEVYLREAMEGLRRTVGDHHHGTLIAIANMGLVLCELGHLHEADRFGAEAVDGARAIYEADHWRIAVYSAEYAQTLAAMKQFEEAEQLMLDAHAIFESSLGLEHDRTIAIIEHLAALYDAWHEAEPDAGHDLKAAEWRATIEHYEQDTDPST